MKTSTKMVRPILESMYKHRREMVPCFIGAPGIGKTQAIYSFAKDKNVNVTTFILSNTVPSEVSGIRMPDKESKKLEVFDDSRMASLEDGDILFFDEILEAPPMLWSACLTLIQDRIMASGRKLPDVFIVAASNQVASPGIIPASTRDRFQFIELQFDSKEWIEWFIKNHGVNPSDILTKIQEDSNQYNILTPRRVTKLYTWLKNAESDEERSTIRAIIADMFDLTISDILDTMVKENNSGQVQVMHALDDAGIDIGMDVYDLSYMSTTRILIYLQSLSNWDEIRDVLSNVKFEGESEGEDECTN